MKTVDIIRPGSINSIIGPVGTLKRMLKYRSFFEEKGYDLTVFTNDSILVGGIRQAPSDDEVRNTFKTDTIVWKVRHAVGSFIRAKARNWNIFAIYLLNKSDKSIRKLVDYYIGQNRHPNIVQFHSNIETYYYLKNRKERDAKTVMFLHTDGYPFKMLLQYYPRLEKSRYFKRYKEKYDWTVANVDQICFIARIGQCNFLEFYPNRSVSNTGVILNGINDFEEIQRKEIERLRSDSATPSFKYRMCCTGTINNRKGHRFIIEALHKLPYDKLADFHVDFLGEGAERQALVDLVKSYGLEKHFTFYGIVPNVDVYKYLAKNNIYILMSKNEGLPISIIEAMRASMMIISTNVSGIPELVEEGYNGFLLNPDSDELAGLLQTLSNYDIEGMGQKSRIRYENEFTFDRMQQEFCQLYDKLSA